MIQGAVIGANGEAAVVSFSDRITVLQDVTGNADLISNAFADLRRADTGDGKMLDAVSKALDMLSKRSAAASSSILVIGENKDRGSESKLRDLLQKIERSPVTIDTPTTPRISLRSRQEAVNTLLLTMATGSYAASPKQPG